MTGLPSRSRPSAIGSSRSSRRPLARPRAARAGSRCAPLGSAPRRRPRPCPGIGATRIERRAHRERQVVGQVRRSGPIFTPGRRRTSNWVTTGPVVRPATSPSDLEGPQRLHRAAAAAGRAAPSPASMSSVRGAVEQLDGADGPDSFVAPARAAARASWPASPSRTCRRPSRGLAAGAGGLVARRGRLLDRRLERLASRLALAFRLCSAFAARRLPRVALPPARSGCRSSRCSGCQANVASVSARERQKAQPAPRPPRRSLAGSGPRRSRAPRPTEPRRRTRVRCRDRPRSTSADHARRDRAAGR